MLLKNIYVVILLMLGMASVSAQSDMQSIAFTKASSEKVIGTIEEYVIPAGTCYEFYRSKSIWSGFQHEGFVDRRREYSYNELYESCLRFAKRKYGDIYPNLYLKDLTYRIEERSLPDEHKYSQVIGSEEEYKYKDIVERRYYVSATVVVDE